MRGDNDRLDEAVERYREGGITVSRGAEIARVRYETFKEELEDRGVEIRFGPGSVEELHEDEGLDYDREG